MKRNLEKRFCRSRHIKYKGIGVIKGRVYKKSYFRQVGYVRMLTLLLHGEVWITRTTLAILLFGDPKKSLSINTENAKTVSVPVLGYNRFGGLNGYYMTKAFLYNLDSAQKIATEFNIDLHCKIFRDGLDPYIMRDHYIKQDKYHILKQYQRLAKSFKTIIFSRKEL